MPLFDVTVTFQVEAENDVDAEDCLCSWIEPAIADAAEIPSCEIVDVEQVDLP